MLLLLTVAATGLPARPVAAQQGLPAVTAGTPVGGLVPDPGGTGSAAGRPPVEVTRLVLAVNVHAEKASLSLLPARVTATVEARYGLRLVGGDGRPQPVSLRFLAPPDVDVQWDGRPAELYPAQYPPAQPAQGGAGAEGTTDGGSGGGARGGAMAEGTGAWLDPLTGRFYPVEEPVALGASQALGTDVVLRPGQEHQLQLRFPRVALGWDAGRYLSPAYQLVVPLHPAAWAGFGPVDVHVSLPAGYVAGLAGITVRPGAGMGIEASLSGAEDGQGRLGPYAYRRWQRPPSEIYVATTATAGMWGRLVTHRRDVLWLLVLVWLAFAALRAVLWRVGRRRDAWAWAAMPALLALPVLAGWVSWQSLRVPLWGYPFSLIQYALWVALGLYVAGRIVGDLAGFLWLRWRYRRAARTPTAASSSGDGTPRADAATRGPGTRRREDDGLTAPAGGS
ncbi:hypothetical protein Tmar_2348 [Thermaerobacter marianensis DSM 12885]|uniref:Uncharacterized protein n=1 Tax=Thermaerobacter marianensis (strain ATCC 700841 / DSM 12885 / JCM 10246 / 7p75a) TaxID=644966 RepID=E6SLI3_THEM7|nr:hypothetical protein [Thermaerobacter marianensis]ADU52425.1 hypothetical protein Tmar_2348 [Thermaerobacter marianensis DSM 12885]